MVRTRSQRRELYATVIQRAFRAYLRRRFKGWLYNYSDNDPITLEPVGLTPKHRIFTMSVGHHRVGYDSYAWIKWLIRHDTHPLTREPISIETVHACFNAAQRAHQHQRGGAPTDVRACLDRYGTPLRVHYITVLSVSPVRWSMLMYLSPLYHLSSLDIQISKSNPPYASVLYDVIPRRRARQTQRRQTIGPSVVVAPVPEDRDQHALALGSDLSAAMAALDVAMDLEDEGSGILPSIAQATDSTYVPDR